VSDCCLVYLDVVIIIEVQELLSSQLGPIIGDDGVGVPKAEDNVLEKAYHLFGANYRHGLSFNPLSESVDHDQQVGEALGHFSEGSQEV
jgi:hypothetical protein